MERGEPTLVPEWLRSTGSITGGGSSVHHSASSPLHSDASSLGNNIRSKSSKATGDYDGPHSVFLERTSPSNSRRSSSSNGFTRHPYSSFSRSHRDNDRNKDKERFPPDHWDRDCSDPGVSILDARIQKDVLRRSRSMVSGKQSDVFPGRARTETKISSNSSYTNNNSVASSGSVVSSIRKTSFEKDFPSLGTEEKHGVPNLGRVSSPGLSTAVHSLPIGNSSVIGGEGWTSALAEVPSLIASSSNGSSSVQQTAVSTSVSRPPNAIAGLNMAEALAQAPSRALNAPQQSVPTQRLEQLALKQSRQLIPMTPSVSKASTLNSSDKVKPKAAARTAEMVVPGKSGQQQQQFSTSNIASQSLRGFRSDASKATHGGKFLVLKPVWENGVSSTPKDASSPTNNTASGAANSQLAATPVSASAALQSSSESKPVERKTTSLAPNAGSTVERRLSSAQAQSRNDFFNLMRKKSSVNHPPLADPGCTVSSPNTEKFSNEIQEAASLPVNHNSVVNGGEVNSNGTTCENSGGFSDGTESNLSPDAADLEEEEARFLRSLGWEETTGDDEGLTEEEINSFLEAYLKSKPGVQPKLPLTAETHVNGIGGALRLSSSNSGPEV